MLATDTYRHFLDALNARDLAAAATFVDTDRYEENCVGFTPGFVGWSEACTSLEKVWTGVPDLRVDLVDLFGDDRTALARGRARGTNSGRLYGVPPTRRTYELMDHPDPALAHGLPMVFRDYREWSRAARDPVTRTVGLPGEGSVVEPLR